VDDRRLPESLDLGDPGAAAAVLEHLSAGEVNIEGRMPWSSNGTFLVHVVAGGTELPAVYKPVRGERPLWDFPSGLYRREVAAYRLSEAMGLGLVPPTVIRSDAPLGEGSLQLFVPADFEQHYFTLHESRADLHPAMQDICMFDVVANNTDRKSGHVLLGLDGRLWAIDNGLCFAEEFKLRTVIWEFGGEPLPERLVDAAGRIATRVPLDVACLLSDAEAEAVQDRARAVVARGVFPVDRSGRRYPWPLV
jgi:uncharacterized repeat protein (TIGR03843 family)